LKEIIFTQSVLDICRKIQKLAAKPGKSLDQLVQVG
jgi:hypothetical protein